MPPTKPLDEQLARAAADVLDYAARGLHGPASSETSQMLRLMAVPGLGLGAHASALLALTDASTQPYAGVIRRVLALHASRGGDVALMEALVARGDGGHLLEVDRAPMPEATLRFVVARQKAEGAPASMRAMARYLQDATRFGSDVAFVADDLVALLGQKPVGLGRRRVDVAQAARDTLARLCRHPVAGGRIVARLEDLARGRGAAAADALTTLCQHRTWTGEWAALDPLLAAPRLAAPAAAGLATGIYQRIFFGEIGDGRPDASWEAAARDRLAALVARAPRGAARAVALAQGQLRALEAARGRGNRRAT